MIFVSHFLATLFQRTNIPDVLMLMVIGLIVGHLLGWVSTTDFGKVGLVIAAVALVVILLERGTSLRLDMMGKSLGTTGKPTVGCFIATGAIVTSVAVGKLVGGVLSSLIFAVTLGILGGIGWLLILGKVRDFPNTISTTIRLCFSDLRPDRVPRLLRGHCRHGTGADTNNTNSIRAG